MDKATEKSVYKSCHGCKLVTCPDFPKLLRSTISRGSLERFGSRSTRTTTVWTLATCCSWLVQSLLWVWDTNLEEIFSRHRLPVTNQIKHNGPQFHWEESQGYWSTMGTHISRWHQSGPTLTGKTGKKCFWEVENFNDSSRRNGQEKRTPEICDQVQNVGKPVPDLHSDHHPDLEVRDRDADQDLCKWAQCWSEGKNRQK